MVAPPANLAVPKPWKLAAIDYAVDHLGASSFADLGAVGLVYGQYAFHMVDKPSVTGGVLVDDDPRLDHEWVSEQAERRRLRLIRGNLADPDMVRRVGPVDAVLLYEVLLHAVNPDWDELLRMWAPATSTFLIAQPQWDGATSTRLLELGRDGYQKVVPHSKNHASLFDRLDENVPRIGRPWRDAHFVWQWGITDDDLRDTMNSLGFSLRWREDAGPFGGGSEGFTNRAFVFSRTSGS